jgi:hypothetical protein
MSYRFVWWALGSLYYPFVIVSSSRFDLCDHLSEERVERDPTLHELLNEDVGLFVNLNLGINLVSLVTLCLLLCCYNICLLVEPIL